MSGAWVICRVTARENSQGKADTPRSDLGTWIGAGVRPGRLGGWGRRARSLGVGCLAGATRASEMASQAPVPSVSWAVFLSWLSNGVCGYLDNF